MKIEIINGHSVRVTPETDFEQHFWDTLKKEKAQLESSNESLTRNIKILAEDNSYLQKLLRDNNIEY